MSIFLNITQNAYVESLWLKDSPTRKLKKNLSANEQIEKSKITLIIKNNQFKDYYDM